jgi:hypothetical protein
MVQPNVHMHPLPAFPQGFSRAAFGDYRDANGVPRGTSAYSGDLNSGTNVALLTPAVVAAAKLHAGCSSLTSAAIENDGGAGACVKRGRRQAVAARRALALPAPPCFLSPTSCPFKPAQARPAATGSTVSSWCAVVWGSWARLRRRQRPPPLTAPRASFRPRHKHSHACAPVPSSPSTGRSNVWRLSNEHPRQEVADLQHDHGLGGGHGCVGCLMHSPEYTADPATLLHPLINPRRVVRGGLREPGLPRVGQVRRLQLCEKLLHL